MDAFLNHVAALETTARDYLFPVCGFGVAWCVIGVEAIFALVALIICSVTARFVWRNKMAVLFVIAILAGATLAGLLGFG